jgi:hypothetical protein
MKKALVALGIIGACALAVALLAQPAIGSGQRAPRYRVDARWPKPLPNQWLIGQVGGLTVDRHDHIWINQRPRSLTDDERGAALDPPRSICCRPAPSVMEFDRDGNLLRAWGGPEDPGKCVPPACQWPATEHGIFVDDDDHVWVGGNGANDRMLLKFELDGTFLLMIGDSFSGPPDSNSTTSVGRAADIFVDTARNEIYVADGYLNRRVVKFNATTGAFIRGWGAYGNPPVDLPEGEPQPPDPDGPYFNRPVHCVVVSNDGIVYVCDRVNNRIQTFDRNGNFLRQLVFDPATLGNGAIWKISLQRRDSQRLLFYADGENNFIRILERSSGEILSTFGRNGRNAGQFHWVHQIGIDSHGNVYTGEVDTSKRLQKFVPRNGEGEGHHGDD